MNVTVNRAEFLAAAKRAASVAPLSSPLEPLRGILLETDRREGCLTISATNLEVSLVQTIPCTSLDADALVLNARLLEGCRFVKQIGRRIRKEKASQAVS